MTYAPSKSPILKLWKTLGVDGFGRWLVSKIVCFNAPYFSSIKPRFTQIKPGLVEVKLKKHRAVQNHIKTVHAIAMCNAAELAGGVCLDVSLNGNFRWIPVGMTVQYLKMAKTDLRAVCKVDDFYWDSAQDVVMPVSVFDTNGEEVFHADITMRISPKKK
ncbi:hotdog fold domain-containing protein [Microbulbifer elongatus]|uniref:hotdog fold domain-containing protein n=1 Tax=Microbulbifer elongatus TaxID=86173 RepID=UPI001CFEDFFF|nr:hotdog fold domain-containing protein [Microbulbifer elongatus]